jgi:hypothetical protein
MKRGREERVEEERREGRQKDMVHEGKGKEEGGRGGWGKR